MKSTKIKFAPILLLSLSNIFAANYSIFIKPHQAIINSIITCNLPNDTLKLKTHIFNNYKIGKPIICISDSNLEFNDMFMGINAIDTNIQKTITIIYKKDTFQIYPIKPINIKDSILFHIIVTDDTVMTEGAFQKYNKTIWLKSDSSYKEIAKIALETKNKYSKYKDSEDITIASSKKKKCGNLFKIIKELQTVGFNKIITCPIKENIENNKSK